MKAVVMELRDGQAAILTADGSFEIVQDQGYSIGQTIQVEADEYLTESYRQKAATEYLTESYRQKAETGNGSHGFRRSSKQHSSRSSAHSVRYIPRVAAAIVVCVLLAGGITTYAVPYSTVSIDVNPSFAVSLNVYDRILSVNAYSEDDREAAERLQEQVKGKTLSEGVEAALDYFDEQSYLEEGTSEVVTSVSSHFGRNEKLQTAMEQSVEVWNRNQSSLQKDSRVDLDVVELDNDLINEAKDLGVSPGKLGKVKQLQESADDPTEIDTNEWLNRPVREIEQEIIRYRGYPTITPDGDVPDGDAPNGGSREDADDQGQPPAAGDPNGTGTIDETGMPGDSVTPPNMDPPGGINNQDPPGGADFLNNPDDQGNSGDPNGSGMPPEGDDPGVTEVPNVQADPDGTVLPPGMNDF